MTHRCPKCGEEKQLSLFRKHRKEGPYESWNLRDCKECVHKEYALRYSDKQYRDSLKKSSRDWKKKNPKRHAEINNAWYHANKEKARAGGKLRYAVRKGLVGREGCEVCGRPAHGHHDSYEEGQEYSVRWLCHDHHKAWHIVLDYAGTKKDLDKRFEFFLKTYS